MLKDVSDEDALAARRRAMSLLARALTSELKGPLAQCWADHGARDLKLAETGLVMLRGRAGGYGAPFNVGEATVTRAVVELPGGERGYAHILGRDAERARLAAIFDALWQQAAERRPVEDARAGADRRPACDSARQGERRDCRYPRRIPHLEARRGRNMSALGFADPAFESQAAFRAILSAMASPGAIEACGNGPAPPPPLAPAAAAAIFTLADFATPLWIAQSLAANPEAVADPEIPHRRPQRRLPW